MKNVIIFNCSVKDPKYSTTKAWSDLQVKRFLLRGVNAKVITLKDYDYEASKDEDKLHEQLKYVYDADLMIFASPLLISRPSFYYFNLIDRFIHAHKKSTKAGLDIFKNKFIEHAVLFGSNWERCNKTGKLRKLAYSRHEITNNDTWNNHHGVTYNKLGGFINVLGVEDLCVSTWSPDEKIGPQYFDMEQHADVVAHCDRVVDVFLEKTKDTSDSVPKCSPEAFLDFFKSEDEDAFGRGDTLSVEDLNEENVKNHINYIKEKIKDVRRQGMIWILMKERCTTAGRYDLGEFYYYEQFYMIQNPQYRGTCSGNYRPNGY